MAIENRKVFFIRSIFFLISFFLKPSLNDDTQIWSTSTAFFDNLTVKIDSQSPVRFVAVSLNGLSLQAFQNDVFRVL